MPHINLLPWREELRKQRRKEFIVNVVIAAITMGVVVGLVHFEFHNRIKHQESRNAYLQEHIDTLDKGIEEIRTLEEKKERLIARMQIIQRLQASRPEIVRIFDQFVSTLPDGVFFKKLAQRSRTFTIDGVAQSNARVSSLMRNLDSSEMLTNPELIEIKADKKGDATDATRLSDFSMRISQMKPKTVEEDQEDEPS